jgi:hypothetical protein
MEYEWIEGPPTRPGYYWIRTSGYREPLVAEVRASGPLPLVAEARIPHIMEVESYVPGRNWPIGRQYITHHMPLRIPPPPPSPPRSPSGGLT